MHCWPDGIDTGLVETGHVYAMISRSQFWEGPCLGSLWSSWEKSVVSGISHRNVWQTSGLRRISSGTTWEMQVNYSRWKLEAYVLGASSRYKITDQLPQLWNTPVLLRHGNGVPAWRRSRVCLQEMWVVCLQSAVCHYVLAERVSSSIREICAAWGWYGGLLGHTTHIQHSKPGLRITARPQDRSPHSPIDLRVT